MSQDQEYQTLAKKFVDMWQDRMATTMHDGEFVRMLLKMMQTAPFSASAASSSDQGFTPHAASSNASRTGGSTNASDPLDATLARLERRLASIEHRIAGIEASNRPAASPKRKRISRAVAKPVRRSTTSKGSRGRSKK